jgi:predicted ATPase
MNFLSAIRRREEHRPDREKHPWSVPMIHGLMELDFTAPVTFLVGENGSGKSTLLEGLAAGMDAVAVGRRDLKRDPSLAAARAFAEGFFFTRHRHARTRLFLRAEDVFGFTQRVEEAMVELREDARALDAAMPDGYGKRRAMGTVLGQAAALARDYGENPDGKSHGETFLAVLRHRMSQPGLYFLDEPETPLSPSRVLALMAVLTDLVGQGSQFIIATHSPILMALPGAAILEAADGVLRPAAWGDIEHVRVTRAFLANPEGVLARLLGATAETPDPLT